MTMYADPIPEMPQEFIDLAASNPEGFAEAMESGMEAMTAAMGDGASIADSFEAMGEAMGPMMEEMGISPEVFEAAGDAVGAAIGPAMHMAPADASPADMGAMMQDGMGMMMPEGVDCPAPIMDAMGDMGTAMGDAGMNCHDVGAEMMGDPGSDTYLLPIDGQGNPVVEPGAPETCPADSCQPPPADGACAANGNMPPEGGYEHVTETGGDTGELSTLGDALGGDSSDGMADNGPDQNDTAVGAAMDSATEQGGGQGSGGGQGQDFGNTGEGEESNDSQDVDSSAGMG